MEEFMYDIFNVDEWWWAQGRRALIRAFVETHTNGTNDKSILDIGCGTGTIIRELSSQGTVLGIDTSPKAVYYCRERGITTVCLADAASLPYRDESLDVVVGTDVLEHLDDDALALKEVYRVCKPGGTVVMTVPAFQFLWGRRDELNHHRRRYTLKEFKKRLLAAGFQVVRCTYVNLPLFVPLALLTKVGNRVWREPNPTVDFVLVPPAINHVFARIMGAEATFLRHSNLPIGTSIVGVARRPAE